MNTIKNLMISTCETIGSVVRNRVVWQRNFERIIIRKFRLVHQEATIHFTTGSIVWIDVDR
jgi:hypothetical protein